MNNDLEQEIKNNTQNLFNKITIDLQNIEIEKGRLQEEVKEYLVRKGVRSDRLVATGYGEDNPIGDNSTEEGRSLNRRVEMQILEVLP